jgi:integrase
MRTTFHLENEGLLDSRTDSAQISEELTTPKMRFPKVIRHQKAEVTIYGKKKNYPFYRIIYRADGKRRMQHFAKYSDALKAAETKAEQLWKAHPIVALSAVQTRDAITAIQMLDAFRPHGERIALSTIVSEAIDLLKRASGRSMREVGDGFLASLTTVNRKDLATAASEFLQAADVRAKSPEGQRAQISSKYAYNRRKQLEKFAAAFPGTAVSELTKAHVDQFFESLGKIASKSRNKKKAISAKSRNHYRAVVRQFFAWAVRKDYLPPNHRLTEAESLRSEIANTTETLFYTPDEFLSFLVAAKDELADLRPIIAIGGFAGLRTAEMLRLDWQDIWRVPDHIEVSAGKSKTRQRRLVETCPALKKWLEPYVAKKTGPLWKGHEVTFQQKFVELCESAKLNGKSIERKSNGLRHAFCTYHYALHANENLTSQQAGNSPAMIHQHYKGLATKTEAEKWFGVMPPKSA